MSYIVPSYCTRTSSIAVLLLLLFCASSAKAQDAYVPGEIIVKFREGSLERTELARAARTFQVDGSVVKHKQLRKWLTEHRAKKLRRVIRNLRPHHETSRARTGEEVTIPDLYNLMVLEVPEHLDLVALCDSLEQMEGIVYAEPNYYLYTMDRPAPGAEAQVVPFGPGQRAPVSAAAASTSDPNFQSQLSFEQTNDVDVDASRAWDFTTGSKQVRVAVIDTGIDYNHEDLGNGAFGAGAKVSGGYDYYNNDSDPEDDISGFTLDPNYHGTKVAGIIGAYRNNSIGIAGLAGGDSQAGNMGVQLFALKAGTASDGSTFTTAAIIEAITDASLYVAEYGFGAHVINLSIGKNYSSGVRKGLREALSVAAQNGVVVAAASGNGSTSSLVYPAAHDPSWIIAVGASGTNDLRMSVSNYGSKLDVVAPGDPSMVLTTQGGDPDAYVQFKNTSAATPHVAGLAALLKAEAYERGMGLSLHPQDIEGIIKASADKVRQDVYTYNQDGWHEQVGYGRINAGKALEMFNAPYVFDHRTSYGGTVTATASGQSVRIRKAPGLTDGQLYYVVRREVRKTVTFPRREKAYVWGRGANASTGWSAVSTDGEIYGIGFSEVVPGSVTNSSATLRTYVYDVYNYDYLGRVVYPAIGTYPTTPANVTFAYTVIGKLDTTLPPAAPTGLSVTGSPGQHPHLTWNASTGATSYKVYRCSNISYQCSNFSYIGSTSNTYYTDTNKTLGTQCGSGPDEITWYYVTAHNSGGASGPSNKPTTCTDASKGGVASGEAAVPETFALHGNHPNPFNPSTEIRFDLPETAHVRLVVYDLLGREIARLVDQEMAAGYQQVTWDAGNVPSGVYFYRIQAGDFAESKQMLLLK